MMEHILNLLETLDPISCTIGINMGETVKARERYRAPLENEKVFQSENKRFL